MSNSDDQAKPGRWVKGQSGNPGGRPKKATVDSGSRLDGWSSILSGIGNPARDKRESHLFNLDIVSVAEARNLYRGDPMAARIVESKPNDATREGFDFCVSNDGTADAKDLQEAVEYGWDRIGLVPHNRQAAYWEAAYGGAAVLMGVDDGARLDEPLNLKRVRRGPGVTFLSPLEPDEITPVTWYGDPTQLNFNKPEYYQLTTSTHGIQGARAVAPKIHESRLLIYPGARVTNRVEGATQGWGDSVFTRIYRVLRDFNLTWSAAGILVVDFAQGVYKMKGLNDLLAQDAKDIFKQRMLGMAMAQSVARMVMIDSEDEYDRKQTPVNGLPDLMDRFATHLAAAADLPLPVLLGESPGGINASGASGDQLRMYYDRCMTFAQQKFVPAIRKVTEIQLRGMGVSPSSWSIKPRPLWQATDKEKTETRKIQGDTDALYIDRGVLTALEVRESRFGGDAYSTETSIKTETEPSETGTKTAIPGAPPESTVVETTPSAPTQDVQKTAFNEAQITSMLEVIQLAASKIISRESALATLEVAFQLDPADAARVLGPVTFEPAKPPTPPAGNSPFGNRIPAPGEGAEESEEEEPEEEEPEEEETEEPE